ncbi:MAG TPA: response regulator transcription factor [Panacibacter sp.]|nr:response regulator transcription factor [Panacibacter sp.]HNP43538.1 response regulator transcription factor [Panacibacter sp.]
MLRILIADDHIVVRRGLKQILFDEFPTAQIEEAGDAEELLKKLFKAEFDLVISDLSMPGRSGLDSLQQIKQSYPKLPVLILSVHSEEHYALRVLKSGGSGYLNKDSAPEELVKAVRQVLMGKKYITASVAEKLAASFDKSSDKLPHEVLSDREFEVFKLIASGKSITDIAGTLSLSITTISTYRARIMEKMNLHTNADLTLYAVENKII